MILKMKRACLITTACILAATPASLAYAEETTSSVSSTVEEVAEAEEESSNKSADDNISALLKNEAEKPDTSRGFPFYNNPKKPAPMGIWLKAYRLSYADSDDHVVYFRVNRVMDAAQEDIEAFNAVSDGGVIGPLSDPYLKYMEIEYDVYFPKDFVVGDDGYVVDPTLSFSIVNPAGGGFVTERGIYSGLSKVQTLDTGFQNEDGLKIHPGEVFHGKSIFAMLIDEPVYCLEYACRQKEPDGEVRYQYSECIAESTPLIPEQ